MTKNNNYTILKTTKNHTIIKQGNTIQKIPTPQNNKTTPQKQTQKTQTKQNNKKTPTKKDKTPTKKQKN